jgi:phage shock protein C
MMETRRILRSRNERMIAGVAGGLATYFSIDPLVVRLGFALLSMVNGIGVMLYVLLWLLLPNEDSVAADSRGQVRENVDEMRTTAENAAQRVRDMFNKS